MNKRFFFILAIFATVLGLCNQVQAATVSATGSNNVSVSSCEQVTNGVKISRNNGTKYVLSNGCRDAGHGMRNYFLVCVNSTQYNVSWTNNCSAASQGDAKAPKVNLSYKRYKSGNNAYANFTATASDNIKVTKIEIYRNDLRMKICTGVKTCSLTDGPYADEITYRYEARAYDKAGNVGYSSVRSINYNGVEQKDMDIPTVTVYSDNHTKGQVRIWTHAAVGGDDIVKTEIYSDGKLASTCKGSVDCILLINPTEKTTVYNIVAKAYDADGNVGQSDVFLASVYAPIAESTPVQKVTTPVNMNNNYVALLPPTISVDARYAREKDADYVVIKGSANSGSSIARIELYWGPLVLDTTMVKRCDFTFAAGSASCEVSFPMLLARHGFYRAVVFDVNGGVNQTMVREYSM